MDDRNMENTCSCSCLGGTRLIKGKLSSALFVLGHKFLLQPGCPHTLHYNCLVIVSFTVGTPT